MPIAKHSDEFPEKLISSLCSLGTEAFKVSGGAGVGKYQVFRRKTDKMHTGVMAKIPGRGANEMQFFTPDCNIPDIS